MTILAYCKGYNFELIVCGDPSAAWIEWVRTTTVPLTAGQVAWRQLAQDRVDRAERLDKVPGYPRTVERPEACVHRDSCDRCGFCETCTCECHELGGAG